MNSTHDFDLADLIDQGRAFERDGWNGAEPDGHCCETAAVLAGLVADLATVVEQQQAQIREITRLSDALRLVPILRVYLESDSHAQ